MNAINNPETKPCKCGKKMIKRYGGMLLTYPTQLCYDWWCGCGHTETGGTETQKTEEEILKEKWEEANG